MKLKFFSVPAIESAAAELEVNRFLATHRVLAIDRQLASRDCGAFWTLCVVYQEADVVSTPGRKGRTVDYREVLSETDFTVFARLRNLRKTLAERDGVPLYAIFTNEQLATMVRQRVASTGELGAISGVGPQRIAKYGAGFLGLLKEALPVDGDGG